MTPDRRASSATRSGAQSRIGSPACPSRRRRPSTGSLRANALWRQDPSLKGTLGARPLYEEALRLDPNFAPALVGLGYTLLCNGSTTRMPIGSGSRGRSTDVSLRAIRADPDDPNAWVLRTNALSMQGREREALEANAAALKIDPYLCATLHEGRRC